MKRFLVYVALLLASAYAGINDYYPNEVGLGWLYTSGEEQRFAKSQNGLMLLERRIRGTLISTDYLRYTAQGVLLEGSQIGSNYFAYNPALPLYPAAPLRVGQSWNARSAQGGRNIALSVRVERQEGVQVPAGRFNAFVIRSSVVSDGGASSVTESYFVPGFGVVRLKGGDGNAIDLQQIIRP